MDANRLMVAERVGTGFMRLRRDGVTRIGGQLLIDPAINRAHDGAAAHDEPLPRCLQKN